MRVRVSLCTLSVLALAGVAGYGQTPTGTLQGTVLDQSGAVVPSAVVRITNVNTNESKQITTENNGRYVAPLLPPDTYTITVEATGFRPAKQDGVKLDVGQNRSVDFTLSVGAVSEEVQVLATAPPLDVNTSSIGQVIDRKKIVDLPLNGRNPFSLALLTPGVISSNSGESTPHMGGSRNAVSEAQIDGVSNIVPENNVGINDRAYTPQVDAVQEFNVQVNNLSAEYGRFGGGVINLVTKSGTNALHGTVYEFARRGELDANNWFSNRNGNGKPDFKRDQWGGTVGAPVFLPGLYNGHDRTFFFFGFEATRNPGLAVATRTVPLAAWKTGNFTGEPMIYDPLTIGADGARQPFAGNKVPASRIDPIAAKAITFFPDPNAGGAGATSNNFFRSGTANSNENRWDSRMDHSFSEKWRTFGRVSHSWGDNTPLEDYGNVASTGWDGPTTSGAWSASLDNTISFSPTLLANFRYGASRKLVNRVPFSAGFDVSELGYSPQYVSVFQQRSKEFPRYNFNNGGDGLGPNGWVTLTIAPLVHQFTGSLTKITSSHNIKFGGEFRKLYLNFTQFGHPAGQYNFSRQWTQKNPDSPDGSGQQYASFLLGLFQDADVRHEPTAASSSTYFGFYVQDDWRLSRKLTLNLGLRWDVDVPRTERFDRLSYFNPDLPSPIAGKVPANACARCSDLRGQILFVNDTGDYGRHQGPTPWHSFAPRFGFAYQATSKMAIRGGFGLFFAPSALQAAGTSGASGMLGFDSSTFPQGSLDSQRTIFATVTNPAPQGFNLPQGRAGGPGTYLGYGQSDAFFDSYRTPYSEQWNLNVQHELPGNMTIEFGYLGNRGLFLVDGDPGRNYSQLDPQYLSLGNQLLTSMPNPFYNVITAGGSPLSQRNIQYRYLLRPFPQYDGVSAFRKPGANSIFHGFTVRADKRFSNGLTFLLAFTGSKTMDDSTSAVGFLGDTGSSVASGSRLDQYNRHLDWAVSAQDISRRLVMSFAYDIPFGRGKALFNDAGRIANAFVSGWQANGILTWQNGAPIIISGVQNNANIFGGQRPNNNGTSALLDNSTIDRWFNGSVFSQPAVFTLGNAPRTLPDTRGPGQSNADLSLFKNNYFGRDERFNVQFRTEWFNALNHPQWGTPDRNMTSGSFAVVNSTAVSPRQIQMAVKFIF